MLHFHRCKSTECNNILQLFRCKHALELQKSAHRMKSKHVKKNGSLGYNSSHLHVDLWTNK